MGFGTCSKMKPESKVTIKIPRPLYNNLKDLIGDSGFNSVSDFIVYILRDMVSHSSLEEGDRLTSEELETVKERLRNLGYFS